MKVWKHCLLMIVVFALTLFVTQGIFAYETGTTNGLKWSAWDSGITITGYEGTSSVVNIPSKINGIDVVAIGENAFLDCGIIESIIIPESVKRIGNYAFLNCTNLKSVRLHRGLSLSFIEGFYEYNMDYKPFGYHKTPLGEYEKVDGFTIYGDYYTGMEYYCTHYHGFSFVGSPTPISNLKIYWDYDGDYTGKEIRLSLLGVTDENDIELTAFDSNDISISYSNNINAGTATAIIEGKNRITGILRKTYSIRPVTLTGNVKTTPNGYVHYFTGSEIKPGVTVVLTSDNRTLIEGVDYQLTYTNNKNVGMATVTVTGINNYTGSDTASFQIIEDASVKKPTEKVDEKKPTDKAIGAPQTVKTIVKEPITIKKVPSSVKAKAKKNKVTVSWKKIKKNKAGKKLLAQIKSIQVQYSTDKTFKKDVKTKSVGKKKTKVTLKLQKKTTYYVRVRYKGSNGFSKWSKVKKVKTKK